MARLEDVDRLGEIHVAGWRSAYRGVVSDEYLFTKHLVMNSTRMMRSQLESGARMGVFLDDATSILKGFLWVGDSRDTDLPGFDEIYAYYVQPEFKGQGVGSQLMQAFLTGGQSVPELASKRERQSLWVLQGNDRSIRHYERFGFHADGREKTEPGWDGLREIRMQRAGS